MNITLNAKLDRIETLMERIARAMELAVGMPSPNAKEPEFDAANPAVSYSSEAELLRQEWAAKNGLPTDEPFL